MVEHITISAGGDPVEAYVARPASHDAAEHPGVLFFMDALSLRPRIADMAQRIADWGYVVLVPNVFHAYGSVEELAPKGPLDTQEKREAFFAGIGPALQGLFSADMRPRLLADLHDYVVALHALPGVSERPIGVTGYCMGARLAILTAGQEGEGVAATGGFHGGSMVTGDDLSPHLSLAAARADFVFGHADGDRSNTPEQIATLERSMSDAGLTYHSTVYAGAPHGYSMADTANYHHDATEQMFTELRELFERTLK